METSKKYASVDGMGGEIFTRIKITLPFNKWVIWHALGPAKREGNDTDKWILKANIIFVARESHCLMKTQEIHSEQEQTKCRIFYKMNVRRWSHQKTREKFNTLKIQTPVKTRAKNTRTLEKRLWLFLINRTRSIKKVLLPNKMPVYGGT